MSHATTTCGVDGTSIPARAGIGLRSDHYRAVQECLPNVGWLEVHSENYFDANGAALACLKQVRANYPISLHGVGLSLGSTDPLNRAHLAQLKTLIETIEPGFISEHLSWSSVGGRYINDLLPLPYTEEALAHFTQRVQQTQDLLGRRLLIENPSSYLRYVHSTIPEHEFLLAVARVSGCGILLDVNNVYVSAINHRWDAQHYIDALPAHLVMEMHLAGHVQKHINGVDLLIDSHNQPVAEPVWKLYGHAAQRFPGTPTLIEWDSDLPPLAVLVAESERAQRMMTGAEERYARTA